MQTGLSGSSSSLLMKILAPEKIADNEWRQLVESSPRRDEPFPTTSIIMIVTDLMATDADGDEYKLGVCRSIKFLSTGWKKIKFSCFQRKGKRLFRGWGKEEEEVEK